MHLHEILAWSWDGHGSLTSAAISLAIAQFLNLGKSFLEQRFVEIEKVWQGASAKTNARDCLQDLLQMLPKEVQGEDIHPANIPYVGGVLNPKSGQVRHFMRSSESVSSFDAFNASKAYIAQHLMAAFNKWREAIYFEERWYKLETASMAFAQGRLELAAALHAVEDSYAPGHVTRQPATGLIVTVHIWDDENRKPDPSRSWPGHEALDNPDNSLSMFNKAKQACAALILCLLANLDQEPAVFAKKLQDTLDQYFHYAGFTPSGPLPAPAPAPGVFPPSPPPPGR